MDTDTNTIEDNTLSNENGEWITAKGRKKPQPQNPESFSRSYKSFSQKQGSAPRFASFKPNKNNHHNSESENVDQRKNKSTTPKNWSKNTKSRNHLQKNTVDNEDHDDNEEIVVFENVPISVICPFSHFEKSNNSSPNIQPSSVDNSSVLSDNKETRATETLFNQDVKVNKRFYYTTLTELETHLEREHSVKFTNLGYNTLFMQAYLDDYVDKLSSENISKYAKLISVDNNITLENSELEKLASNITISSNENEILDSNQIQNLYLIDPETSSYDKELRNKLQQKRLNEVLQIQIQEHKDDSLVSRVCLFCTENCESTSILFKHMYKEHGFNIGLPDNLVYTNTFLDILVNKLNNLQCLYCEKLFTSSVVLRKHMRKKKHFKISPRNHLYDQFYIINYSEPGKDWEALDNEVYDSDEDRKDNTWDDWVEESESECTSLFDSKSFINPEKCWTYLKEEYGFDIFEIQKTFQLDFYKYIALINYIRTKTFEKKCFRCDLFLDSNEDFKNHIKNSECPISTIFDNPDIFSGNKYLIPVLENDPLLTVADIPNSDDEQIDI
ncbi:hypothetical protein BB558_001767 [Smittium angustum]|uniref:type I protein arginine methyltransferase n=1 Tax=Smittium angustum TaxID=133377 RepID=A0A2U1J1M3_SMIAN|nr:hypothetical protein BB558_005063 [Smittium angustum]PWA02105.1 hypothetical protein BB558_001767 [Smittium angustum]